MAKNDGVVATYDGNCGLIANYINPIIGDLSMQEVTNKVADYYIKTLQQTPSVVKNNRSPAHKVSLARQYR